MGKHGKITLSRFLLIDLDDTLVASEASYPIAMERIGIPQTDPIFLEARKLVKAGLTDLHPSARSRILYFKKYLELKNQFTTEKLLSLIHQYETELCKLLAESWQSLNRDRLFTEFKSRFHKIAVLTNETLRMQVLKLNSFDPQAKYFDILITSEEVGAEKPSPEFFLTALKRLNAKPQDCIMVGDSFGKDIAPCHELQISAIKTIEFLDDQKTSPFHKVIKRLDQLVEVI
jgi:putative hydrolase of the HAD superfamily